MGVEFTAFCRDCKDSLYLGKSQEVPEPMRIKLCEEATDALATWIQDEHNGHRITIFHDHYTAHDLAREYYDSDIRKHSNYYNYPPKKEKEDG